MTEPLDGLEPAVHRGVKGEHAVVHLQRPPHTGIDRESAEVVEQRLNLVRQSGQVDHDRQARFLSGSADRVSRTLGS